MDIEYTLTTETWPDEGVILVRAVDDTRILSASVQFLRVGRVLSWQYITQAVAACIEEQHFELCYRTDAGLTPLDLATHPSANTVYCRLTDPNALPHSQRGPRFHYRHRGPHTSQSETMSHSSRSSYKQSSLREKLVRRDGWCLLTGLEDAIAAHILPYSRPEYYEEVLGTESVNMFRVSCGLFLDRTLHAAFDRGEWAFFPDPENPEDLVVHIFDSRDRSQFHGKILPRSRFRVARDDELPDRRLLHFHYQQCMIKHLRGFPYFPPDPLQA